MSTAVSMAMCERTVTGIKCNIGFFSFLHLLCVVCKRVPVVCCSDSSMPVTSRVCFVRFTEQESVGVSQHLTNTVFVDRALIVVPYAEGWYPPCARPHIGHKFPLAD